MWILPLDANDLLWQNKKERYDKLKFFMETKIFWLKWLNDCFKIEDR